MNIKNLLLAGILSLAIFTSCDDNESSAPADEENIALPQFTTVNATTYEWIYFSFDTGDTVTVNTPEDSEAWDIAFQRCDFKTNSGTSGTANGGAYMTSITDIEDDFNTDTVEVVADDSIQMFVYGTQGATMTNAAGSLVLTGVKDAYAYYTTPGAWTIEGEDATRTYYASPEVFIIKCADGEYAKMKFASYYSTEDGETSGYISFYYIKE